jgi:hypothetical protein
MSTRSLRRDRYFTLDPSFPDRLLRSGNRRTLNCIKYLFQEYSKRNITVPSDRCVAISGLVDRIAGALNCRSAYGAFQKYLHRNLLWQASDGKMEEIVYDHHVPSWSWMGYSGSIQFLDFSVGEVDWVDHLCIDTTCKYALIGDLGDFRNCTMETDGDRLDILSVFDGSNKGWIRYDVENGNDLCNEKCFVIGRADKNYYILVIRPSGADGEYRRVGVGLVRSDCIVKERLNIRVV